MPYLILLIILLILAIIFFTAYPFVKRKILPKKYIKICSRKIERIAKKNNYLLIENFSSQSYVQNSLKINHILFGKKFIYLISDNCLIGSLDGDENDQSWIYRKFGEKQSKYIDNPILNLTQNIEEFAGIFNINAETIIFIELLPNECDLFVKNLSRKDSLVINCSSFKKVIKKFENLNVLKLDEEQVKLHYDLINEK